LQKKIFEINVYFWRMVRGEWTSIYKFENDFYFMLGDNEGSTRDSRHWGAVPNELLIGKATNTIWRKNNGLFLPPNSLVVFLRNKN